MPTQEEMNREVDQFLKGKTLKHEYQGKFVDCVPIDDAVGVFKLRARLMGHPHEYTAHAVRAARERGRVIGFPIGKHAMFYVVDTLKTAPLMPIIPGKPRQKTQSKFRPEAKGYPPNIKEHARNLFENPHIGKEDLEELIAFRGSKGAGITRMRRGGLSLRGILAYLNMTHGVSIQYRTVQVWYEKWMKEKSQSAQGNTL